MKRRVLKVDESRCDGCGRCVAGCREGAMRLIDGKARLVGEPLCDGLGACADVCPRGALRVVEREAEPYDEDTVMDGLVRQGSGAVAAHLRHLDERGERRLLRQALEHLDMRGLPQPEWRRGGHGVPEISQSRAPSRQWPIQLRLLNPAASFFDDADLLVSADCVAHVCGGFRGGLLKNRALAILCPKLDGNHEAYAEKLSEIFRLHRLRSITVARMEVPCCRGCTMLVEHALGRAGGTVEMSEIVVGVEGEILDGGSGGD